MKSINFDTGLRRFAVNKDESNVIEFNAGDINILKRMDTAVEIINKKADKLGAIELHFDGSPMESTSEIIKLVDDFNNTIFEQMNYVFNSKDAAAKLFGMQSPLSMVGGMHLWERIIIALVPLIKDEVGEQLKTRNKKVKKYTDMVKSL